MKQEAGANKDLAECFQRKPPEQQQISEPTAKKKEAYPDPTILDTSNNLLGTPTENAHCLMVCCASSEGGWSWPGSKGCWVFESLELCVASRSSLFRCLVGAPWSFPLLLG